MDDRVQLETAEPPVAERRAKEPIMAKSHFPTVNVIFCF